MEKLTSVLDGDAKGVVAAVGHSELFYTSALKLLKQDFGNPLIVSYKKGKAVLKLYGIQFRDSIYCKRYKSSYVTPKIYEIKIFSRF